MSIKLSKISATTFAVHVTNLGRVGTINKSDTQGDWIALAKVRGVSLKVRSATREGAWDAICASINRVFLCGRDDASAAREALASARRSHARTLAR